MRRRRDVVFELDGFSAIGNPAAHRATPSGVMITLETVNLSLWEPIGRQNLALFGLRTGKLPRPPDESRADHVVPDCPHQGAAEARDPPVGVVAIDHTRDADVGNGADRADHLKTNEAGDELQAG